MPIFIDTDLAFTGEIQPRLRDMIAGLRSGEIPAAAILSQLDSNLSDEIRALVAHRGIDMERFLADVLIDFMLNVADEAWRGVTSHRGSGNDAEAGALSALVTAAVRQMLLHRLRLPGKMAHDGALEAFSRRVG